LLLFVPQRLRQPAEAGQLFEEMQQVAVSRRPCRRRSGAVVVLVRDASIGLLACSFPLSVGDLKRMALSDWETRCKSELGS
jgi:hypothetical protein